MSSFTLWTVRHGQTLYNKKNIIQGHLDIPLSDVGLEQAKMVGLCLQQQNFTHVYSSDLLRARQTAEEVVSRNKSFDGAITYDTRLRERKFGNCEGKTITDLKRAVASSGKSLPDFCPPGGETLKQLHDRAVSFFTDLCEFMGSEKAKVNVRSSHHPRETVKSTNPVELVKGEVSTSGDPEHSSNSVESSTDETLEKKPKLVDNSANDSKNPAASVLLVSHGGFIKELLHHLFTDLLCHYEGKREQAYRLPSNASISKFLVTQRGVTCLQLNYRRHLTSDDVVDFRPDDEVAL